MRMFWDLPEGEIDEGLFFDLVGLGRAGCRRGAGVALDASKRPVACHAAQLRHDIGESSHVGRLLLDPNYLLGGGMLIESSLQFLLRPGIELLEEDYADRHILALGTFDAEIVTDLAAADDEAAGIFDVIVGENVLEGGLAKLCYGRAGVGMTEHRLRREDDERLAPGAHGLTAQKVKVLCCVGGLGYN